LRGRFAGDERDKEKRGEEKRGETTPALRATLPR
jgi:hypothetical protein